MRTRTKAQTQETPLTESFADWAKQNATKVSEDDQKVVLQKVKAILHERKTLAQSEEAIGQNLREMKTILEPKRIFVSSIKYFFRWSKATAYRYMAKAEIAESMLPGPIFEAAIERGTPLKKELITQNPPPNTTDPQKISAYLDTLEELPQRRPQAALETDPEILAKEVLNFAGIRLSRLQASGRDLKFVHKWTLTLAGMLLTKAGVNAEVRLAPVAIPDSFIVHRGAPRKDTETKAA